MAKHAREIIFRRITMAQNKTGHMRWMMNDWMQSAWAMMHGPMPENWISDGSNESLPGSADRAERAYTIMIMDIIYHHDHHDGLDRHRIHGDQPWSMAVMTDSD